MRAKKILFSLFLLALSVLLLYNFYPEVDLPDNARPTHLLVLKSKNELLVYQGNQLLKTYSISLGFNPVGHKLIEGDGKTPEGIYYITDKNPYSKFYKNLGISYPNATDKKKAESQHKSPGGNIKIHGLGKFALAGKFHRWINWTAGCIALTNHEMDELFNCVAVGTPIEIKK